MNFPSESDSIERDPTYEQAIDSNRVQAPAARVRESRPTQQLPSDRMLFERQLSALRAFVAASTAQGGAPVTNEQAAPFAQLSPQTIVVTNAFFCEVGLLDRTGNGQFTVTQLALAYDQAAQWDESTAGHKLRSAFEGRWFSKCLVPHLRLRSVNRNEAIRILADECGASKKYEGQLETLLRYMEVTGIVVDREGRLEPGGEAQKDAKPPGLGEQPGNDAVNVTSNQSSSLQGAELVPSDAPFIYVDREKKKKIVLVGPNILTKSEFDRVKTWFELQFFIEDE